MGEMRKKSRVPARPPPAKLGRRAKKGAPGRASVRQGARPAPGPFFSPRKIIRRKWFEPGAHRDARRRANIERAIHLRNGARSAYI